MGIEQLLDAAYKATLPIRVVDRTIKLGFDAATAVTERAGFDRFRLAKYAAIASGIGAGAAAIGFWASGNYGLAAILGLSAPIAAIHVKRTDEMREYFSNPKDILHKDKEFEVKGDRFFRRTLTPYPIYTITAAILGVELSGMFSSLGSENTLSDVAMHVFVFGTESHLYLIDGDHALWDKTKAKVKSAYRSLSGLMPKPAPLPQPQPLSYNSQVA